jgi:hypothetical protein
MVLDTGSTAPVKFFAEDPCLPAAGLVTVTP